MRISRLTNSILLLTTLLNYSLVFADNVQLNNNGVDISKEPDWRKQNADLSAQEADTAQKNADTARKNAYTASENANPELQMTAPIPAPKEVTPAPQGYQKCFKVAAGWIKNSWVAEHTVCQYNPSSHDAQGLVWIEGYWTCNKYKVKDKNGECTNWDWNPGHWVKSFDVY